MQSEGLALTMLPSHASKIQGGFDEKERRKEQAERAIKISIVSLFVVTAC